MGTMRGLPFFLFSDHRNIRIQMISIDAYNFADFLNMFEASYLNGIEVKCLDHPRNSITCLCLDYKCNENPYLCNECLASMSHKQRHYGHDLYLKELIPATEELSQVLKRTRKPIEAMYMKLNADKQNSSLMKYQEER